jgi:PAS domain S-box-containing protein
MSLADFLFARRAVLVSEFERRIAPRAPGPLSRSDLHDHLPDFLDEIGLVLRRSAVAEPTIDRQSPVAESHGKQRLRIGYRIDEVVREYGVLSDCIYAEILEVGYPATITELRVLSDALAAAAADSAQAYVTWRDAPSDHERRRMLELLEQSPGFFAYLHGPQLVFELANAAYYQAVGHREILGKPVRVALPELADQGFFELLEGVLATGEPFVGKGVLLAIQREPGGPLVNAAVDFIYQPIRGPDGNPVGILVQGHDVTDAHREAAQRATAEAALRASEARYRTLFESIDDGFCVMQVIFDAGDRAVDYRFLETNASFEQHTGLVNTVGRTALEMVPDLDSSWFERYGHVALTGEPSRFESHAQAMGRWFDVYANRVGDPALRQVALVFKDVTARKQAEAENAALLQREQAARQDAEAAAMLRDQFLATVSHELRTPLAAMLGWVQMLRTGALAEDKQARALETIERNARAQAQLIEDLLDVSRILAGQLRIDVEPVEIGPIIEAALETVRPAALARDIKLQVTLSSSVWIMGDTHRLQQVVWNLLSNAVKFTPKGGRVQVVATLGPSEVEISVSDTGKGISPEFLPYVFDRFRQADGATTRSSGGLGLGLSIVRELVNLHGGSVAVASDGEGRGATFSVRLPLAVMRKGKALTPREQAAVPSELTCPPQLAGMVVLVVDDEQDSRDMLAALLRHCGVEVIAVGSAAQARAAIADQVPDVLLSDVGMPDEDGYTLVAQVRALPPGRGGDMPAVALTAYARTEDRARALHAGFDNHIAKPVEPIELLAVVAAFARRRRQ